MTIPIFYSISDDFTKYAAVSLNSLVKHTDPNKDYTVYFLNQDLSSKHQKALSDLSSSNVHVKFFHIDNQLVQPIQNRKENFLRADFFTMSIFYRLFIPELFPEYDKVIYIDSDTIVNDDLAKLYNSELGDNLFAACTDSSIQYVDKMIKYIKNVLALDPKKYINSGMLVMNARAFRAEHFIDHFMTLLEKYHFDCIAPDQDYLNEIGEGRILHLNPRWDAMPNESIPEIQDPKIVHYNLFFKPWHFADVQYGHYFWDVAKTTPYYDELKQQLDNFTDEDRQKARADLEWMAKKVDMIVKEPNTWAKVKQTESVKI